MSIYLILILVFTIGAALLAHHMGVEYGYEHGYNDAHNDMLCHQCRMSEGYATLTPTDNTNERNQR